MSNFFKTLKEWIADYVPYIWGSPISLYWSLRVGVGVDTVVTCHAFSPYLEFESPITVLIKCINLLKGSKGAYYHFFGDIDYLK